MQLKVAVLLLSHEVVLLPALKALKPGPDFEIISESNSTFFMIQFIMCNCQC